MQSLASIGRDRFHVHIGCLAVWEFAQGVVPRPEEARAWLLRVT
jgi:hypothetical protein